MLTDRVTLTEFFNAFFVPEVMRDPNRRAVEGYQFALRYWRAITGDPPLCDITSGTLSDFKQSLKTIDGFYDGGKLYAVRRGKLSQNTQRKYVDHVQWILDQAGPPMAN